MKRAVSAENIVLFLLVLVPVALAMEFVVHAGDTWVFISSAIAVIPLAGVIGRATEHLAERVGAGLGGLLNATFGNAAKLIIAAVALRAGLYDLVKAGRRDTLDGRSPVAGRLRHCCRGFLLPASIARHPGCIFSSLALRFDYPST